MKTYSFLILDTYYNQFLDYFYEKYPFLVESYQAQKNTLMEELFGTADFYSSNLIKLGHNAEDIIINNEILQKKWAEEKKLKIKFDPFAPLYEIPYFSKFIKQPDWIYQIIEAQIKEFNPDIIYSQNISFFTPKFLKKIKKSTKLLIGQIASPMPAKEYLKSYDIILTSFPYFVEEFRKMGINSEYFKIAFENRILDLIKPQTKIYDVSFVGGFSRTTSYAIEIFEKVAQEVPINIWGYGKENLPKNSLLKKNYQGFAWGKKMYEIYNQSKIVLNRHSIASKNYANNMRLYESTGMGAMLITDYKDNLDDLFKIGKEIETYKDASELIEKIKYYLNHTKEREKITIAGQKKTLSEHTYFQRMKELTKIINKYL